MRKIRENMLVAKGDQSLYAADLDVFNSDGTTKVAAGQIVIWDPKTATSLGSTITCSDYDKIVISVGTKNGTLKSCFGDVLYGCEIQAINVASPTCGTVDIWYLYIDSNISCNSNFSVTITVDDDDTRNLFPWNKKEVYTYSVDTQDCACTDCETGFDAFKLACKLRDAINNYGYNALSPTKKAIFKNIPDRSRKFKAALLYGGATSNVVYCINPVAGVCDDCLDADVLIKSIKFDTDEVVVITGTDNPDGDATLIDKLESVVSQINDALGDNGTAILTKGAGACCPWRLEINSCFEDVELHSNVGATAALTACTEANDPFDPVTIASTCPNCTALETKNYTAGIRIISTAVDNLVCDPLAQAPNPNQGVGYRKLEVFPTKGFSCGKSYVRHFQTAAPPENLGYHFQTKELNSSNGGRGRGHENFTRKGYGPLSLPLNIGRESAIDTVCKETYCSYTIEHSLVYRDQTVYGNHVSPRGTTIVLIPTGDSTTRTEFEAIINNYIPSCGCPVKTAVTCA
jgi:hypothetical protein